MFRTFQRVLKVVVMRNEIKVYDTGIVDSLTDDCWVVKLSNGDLEITYDDRVTVVNNRHWIAYDVKVVRTT